MRTVDTIPLGCVQCDGCHAVSPVYAYWPICRECQGTTCPACVVAGSAQDTDGEGSDTCLCRSCGDVDTGEAWTGVVEDEAGDDRS